MSDEYKLKPLGDNILFKWLDAIESETTTASGIILKRDLNQNRNRWGKVIAVGPLSSAKVGEYISPLNEVEAWGAKDPNATELDSVLRSSSTDIWRVRDENVLLITDDINDTMPLNDSRKHTQVHDATGFTTFE